MKLTLLTSLLLGIAAAQDLPIDLYEQAEDSLLSATAPFGADNATLIVEKRSEPTACADQVGNGPHVDPDTDTEFLAYPAFSKAATAAAAHPPQGYEAAPGWIDLKGSNGDNTGYLGYVQSELSSYDPDHCANLCSDWSGSTPCSSFVIYYERDPELVWPTTGTPSTEYCPATVDSSSVTLIKCAFYSVPLYSGNATNVGQYQGDFHLVIAGSTAFNVMGAPVCDGFTGPVDLGNAALNIPVPVILHGYLSVEIFPNAAYSPATCASHCETTSAWNSAHGIDVQCTSFDAYVLYRNGANGIFTCIYYSENYGASYATMTGQFDIFGNHYTVGSSYSYYLNDSPTPKEKRALSFVA
ncbi:hypothetical protein VMCG_06688 [Cytospora schulzeri]|uniref:Apple domain-containing protein n=1 Tax=Cytospora schulzeri TaxID=448051 RepID=A0A423W715_9PEZI|nr:hypothetical protein VMCG_06688 [Valsa malicola]